jgi:hypothetical protein
MIGRLQDSPDERAALVGRAEEMRTLRLILAGKRPIVVHLHGLGGIGKTTLLEAFARMARRRGAVTVPLDGRAIEPTERGMLHAIGAALGTRAPRLDAIAAKIRARRRRVVLLFDNFEVLGLTDTWIRQKLLPALPANARMVLSGRNPPSPGWSIAAGLGPLVRTLALGPLDPRDSAALLAAAGLPHRDVDRVRRFAEGHPLALKLAAWSLRRRAPFAASEGSFQSVIEELVGHFVGDVEDAKLRRALDAASVVRRVTRSVLAAMIGEPQAASSIERLRALPFIESAADGLVLHESVRMALAASLRATDPATHRAHRLAAWRQLRREVRAAAIPELWRYTADLLFLVESPVIREAFFPSHPKPFTVEAARPQDAAAIREIGRAHETEEGASLLERWREALPGAFHVVRDSSGKVAGFYCLFESTLPRWSPAAEDPIVRRWLEILRRDPVPSGQRVLFLRRWLSARDGERVSPVQAACFLDIKRIYLELRPKLRRVYVAFCDPTAWFPIVGNLGFRPIEGGPVDVGGSRLHSAVVDMGPASVDGWLSAIAARELGADEADRLDSSARTLRIDGRQVPLTRLEFELLQFLSERPGEAVPRDVLRREVWGHRGSESSNVVDVIVRSLRKKLGEHAASIQAVRGIGYRYAS